MIFCLKTCFDRVVNGTVINSKQLGQLLNQNLIDENQNGVSHEYCIVASNALRIIQKCCKNSLVHQRLLAQTLKGCKYLLKFSPNKKYCQMPEIYFYCLKLFKLMLPFRDDDNRKNENATIKNVISSIDKTIRIDIGDRWLENQNQDFEKMMSEYKQYKSQHKPNRDETYYYAILTEPIENDDHYFNDDLLKPYKYHASPKLSNILMAPEKRNGVIKEACEEYSAWYIDQLWTEWKRLKGKSKEMFEEPDCRDTSVLFDKRAIDEMKKSKTSDMLDKILRNVEFRRDNYDPRIYLRAVLRGEETALLSQM